MGTTTSATATSRRYATIHDAAAYAASHPDTIRRLIAEGVLGRYQISRRVLVDLNELDAYAARHHKAA